MNQWINFHALWQIVVVGLLCGAGLPAVFAIGLRALQLGTAPVPAGSVGSGSVGSGSGGSAPAVRPTPLALVAAGICFAVVLAAIIWGIYLIVKGS